jgi:hypothetical protein
MPKGAVYVGRPSLFGNPWDLATARSYDVPIDRRRQWCVDKFRPEMDRLALLSDYAMVSDRGYERLWAMGLPTMADYAKRLLRGHDLACWCPLDQPCHADVLLELANG